MTFDIRRVRCCQLAGPERFQGFSTGSLEPGEDLYSCRFQDTVCVRAQMPGQYCLYLQAGHILGCLYPCALRGVEVDFVIMDMQGVGFEVDN